MKRNQGNVIILFIIILLTILIIVLLSLKTKIQKGWNTSPQEQESTKKSLSTSGDSASPTPAHPVNAQPQFQTQQLILSNTEKYEYYNDLSAIQSNETINPFLTSLNSNPPKKITAEPPTQTKASIKPSKPSNPNLIKIAPNGFAFPHKTGYLMGYPVKNRSGKLNITISNAIGRSNLSVFVYFKKPYSEHKNIDFNELISATYVAAGDTFTFKNINSGYYRIVWLNLANKKAYKSKDFAVFQDNKYAYDRIFTFHPNLTHLQNKATQIPLSKLYNNIN